MLAPPHRKGIQWLPSALSRLTCLGRHTLFHRGRGVRARCRTRRQARLLHLAPAVRAVTQLQMVFHRVELRRERSKHEGGPPLPAWIRRVDRFGEELSDAGGALEDVWLVRRLVISMCSRLRWLAALQVMR